MLDNITLQATESKLYRVRTQINASESDLTVYFHDPRHAESQGRILTEKHSNRFILIATPVVPVADAAKQMLSHIMGLPLPVINIAGNAIYRFPVAVEQRTIDEYICNIVEQVSQQKKIGMVRSGGQTGADWGGLVAAGLLNIPCIGTFPFDYRRKNRARKEHTYTEQQIRQMIADSVAEQKALQL